MASKRSPLPGQQSLFPESEPAEIIGGLKSWLDHDLLHLVRAGAYELIRRDLPLPAAVPVVQAAYALIGGETMMGCEVST